MMISKVKDTLSYIAISTLLFVGCIVWWLAHSEYMSYQEQYQLFLFTSDYFAARAAAVGGIADYVSEFVVQFYYVPWMGAVGIAAVITLLQTITGSVALKACRGEGLRPAWYALTVIPAALVMHYMGDENLLMSYPVALSLVMIASLAVLLLPVRRTGSMILTLTMGFALLYWAAGPVAYLFLILMVALSENIRKKPIWIVGTLLCATIAVYLLRVIIFQQYPLTELLLGINYYRISFMHPTALFVIASALLLVCLLPLLHIRLCRHSAAANLLAAVGVGVVAVLITISGLDEKMMQTFRYDMLVRQQKWAQIIREADKEHPTNDFCLQALNLALAKSGILGEKMFEYPQSGIGGLIARYENNNTTCLVSAEVFYHLGMVNSAYRYNFDLQEAIMNDRKSGRFLRRMAECEIINGKYAIAQKYLEPLKHSLFYSDWAHKAEQYLWNEEKIEEHPVWGEIRRVRFNQQMLYDYPEIEKVLGLLAIESGGRNLLAWDYFNAATLLKGDLPTFAGMYHFGPELFGVRHLPKHHQEAMGMFWTFGHQSFDGIPYPISDDTKARITSLAQAVMQNPNNMPQVLAHFQGLYPTYYLKQQQNRAETHAPQPKGAARED